MGVQSAALDAVLDAFRWRHSCIFSAVYVRASLLVESAIRTYAGAWTTTSIMTVSFSWLEYGWGTLLQVHPAQWETQNLSTPHAKSMTHVVISASLEICRCLPQWNAICPTQQNNQFFRSQQAKCTRANERYSIVEPSREAIVLKSTNFEVCRCPLWEYPMGDGLY